MRPIFIHKIQSLEINQALAKSTKSFTIIPILYESGHPPTILSQS